ncbi:inositol monophosphatase family protein [Devosia sp. 63-57]|uniref:inositol monophosphatase family protein n=1 Tax=Devosia sp. 63-57 TaxID=1895751 RepID=UPI00086F2DFC|nr:inositol monophosphatase family protein [Devosia sp. 63-57]ODT49883.1 MAG: inositol monophosphatase [Pelagibacterium sp. SCN 63-126]ODU85913.1 MAG: inositol monophosphatase [Pelagibacterium sp. SCN 63-17]OJX45258.1 MAG: inositol monophosphatase [Devosia sp. 63-57]
MTIDVMRLAAILRDAGNQEIVPRFRNLDEADMGQKANEYDLVTEADLGAERVITAALRDLYPEALIVGEEAYAADKSILSGLVEADLAFVIDPVDGTFNFAAGNGMFGSILAVVRQGETIGGLILDPLRGDVLIGERGAGARLVKSNGQSRPIRVAAPTSLDTMVSVACWSYLPDPMRARVAANLTKVKLAMAYGCSAYEYWMLASGRAHFSASHGVMPWDHLAGALIHAEAGGFSAHFDGTPFRAGRIDAGILNAPDKESWQLIARDILGL